MAREHFTVGQVVRCIGTKSRIHKIHRIKVGELYLVTAVDNGTYSDTINISDDGGETNICTTALFNSMDFEAI